MLTSIIINKKIVKKSQEVFEICSKCGGRMYVESNRDLSFSWVCINCNHEVEINNDSESSFVQTNINPTVEK